MIKIKTIRGILKYALRAGKQAYQVQKKGLLERGYKTDGSVITQIDKRVEDFLHDRISSAFPEANILSEETARSFDAKKPYTFVIDPIDGTDAYSLSMPGWCISIGLMYEFEPVAGIIYSPVMDWLLFADIEKKATLNGKPLPRRTASSPISSQTNIVASSSIHKQVDLSRYPGKVRNAGSAALHLCYPLIYPGIYATLESCHVHIWDILAAHAILRSHGLSFERLPGGFFRYQELTDGRSVGDLILAGPKENVDVLRSLVLPSA